MEVKKADGAQEPGYPSRRQFKANTKALGLAALGAGSLLATGCMPWATSGVMISDPVDKAALVTRLPGDLVVEPKPEPLPDTIRPDPPPFGGIMPIDPKGFPLVATHAAETAHVVKSGETLSGIAKQQLGNASRWREIADLNPGVDPDRIKVGQRLVLPVK